MYLFRIDGYYHSLLPEMEKALARQVIPRPIANQPKPYKHLYVSSFPSQTDVQSPNTSSLGRSEAYERCLPLTYVMRDPITSRRVRPFIGCVIPASLAKISSDVTAGKYPNARHIHIAPPPTLQDRIKHLAANRTSHKMGTRTRRGVPVNYQGVRHVPKPPLYQG